MIEAKRVRLRAGTADDRDWLLTSLNDWTIAEWLPGVPFPYTPKDAADFLELHCKGTFSSAFMVADRESNAAMGVVSLAPKGTESELGYWLAHEHRGRGYMREAVTTLLPLVAVEQPTLLKVFAPVDRKNLPSQTLLRACGFQLVGEHLRATPNRQGGLAVLRFERSLGSPFLMQSSCLRTRMSACATSGLSSAQRGTFAAETIVDTTSHGQPAPFLG